ncbi:MAG: hypothetical protein LBM69_09925 [Lachnospiraceae bacterium]|jgi:hypothetical protein|nr:hypothetical protein [Lachnospiraceae bacterium]
MDSNLRKRVVLLVVLVIGLLTLVVLYQNLRHKTDTTQQPNEESVVTVPFTPQLPPRAQGQIGDDLYAYLDQDAFFDEETDPVIADILEKQKKLFLSINSIEKDLRIQIQNYAGELVTGKRFTVRLNAQDDYTDLDLDGVIYIGDLQPSEVQVELLPIEE